MTKLRKWGTLINHAMVGKPISLTDSETILKAKVAEIKSRLKYQQPWGLYGFDTVHFQKIWNEINEQLIANKAGGKPKYVVYGAPSGRGDVGFKNFSDLEKAYFEAKKEYAALYSAYMKKSGAKRLFSSDEEKRALIDAKKWLNALELIYSPEAQK